MSTLRRRLVSYPPINQSNDFNSMGGSYSSTSATKEGTSLTVDTRRRGSLPVNPNNVEPRISDQNGNAASSTANFVDQKLCPANQLGSYGRNCGEFAFDTRRRGILPLYGKNSGKTSSKCRGKEDFVPNSHLNDGRFWDKMQQVV